MSVASVAFAGAAGDFERIGGLLRRRRLRGFGGLGGAISARKKNLPMA